MPARERNAWYAAAAAAVPLGLYIATAAPTVYGVDSAELSTAAYLLGIAHPPGAPAYLLLGHVFTWLPVGDVGYRLNLLSAAAAALAAGFLYGIIRRLTAAPRLALATAWFIAVSYYVWVSAVAAELYAVQACVVVALIALALRCREDGPDALLAPLGFLFGFGAGVHLSLVLMAPGLALLVLGGRTLPRPRTLVTALLCTAAGASVYGYLPIRHAADLALNPARDYWHVDLSSWDGWWWMVTGGGFRARFFAVAAAQWPAEAGRYAYAVWGNFMGLGAVLGAIGLADDFRRRPWVHAGLLLMVAGHLAFLLPYAAGDKALMFVPTYCIWGIWIGLGARALFGYVATRLGAQPETFAPIVVVALAATTAAVNFPLVDLSADWSARARGEAILGTLEPEAVYFGSFGDVRLVEYLQHVEGRRPDVTPIDLVFADRGERRRRVAEQLEAGRPVYVATCRGLVDRSVACTYVAACDCYRLRAGDGARGGKSFP